MKITVKGNKIKIGDTEIEIEETEKEVVINIIVKPEIVAYPSNPMNPPAIWCNHTHTWSPDSYSTQQTGGPAGE